MDPQKRLIPLSMISQGTKVRLAKINAGRQLEVYLANMGLTPGVELEVVVNSINGPFVVAVRDTRIMLGKGMAHRILVEELKG